MASGCTSSAAIIRTGHSRKAASSAATAMARAVPVRLCQMISSSGASVMAH